MHRTLLSLAAASCVAASLTAQCATPSSFTTTFDGGTFSGAPTLDPGPCLYFDLDVTAGLTITSMGCNFLNDGNTYAGIPVPNLIGTTATVELWLVDITGGLNGGSVTANIPQTYLINGGGTSTLPLAPWSQAPGFYATGTVTIAAPDSPSLATFTTPLHLNPGSYGCVMMMIPNGTTSTTTAPATSTLHPLFTNRGIGSQVKDQIFTLTTRGFRALGFGASPAAQYMPNLVFNYGLDANTALSTSYGNGCYDRKKTFYQAFDGPANPLGAAPDVTTVSPVLSMVPLGSPVDQYFVQPGAGSYPLIVPGSTTYFDTASAGATPSHVNNGNPAVSLFGGWDDSTSALYTMPFPIQHPGGTSTQISICSNGVVYLDSTAGRQQFFHLYTEFCEGPPAFAAAFGDLWPADNVTFSGGTGEIWADSDGVSYVAISWVNCQEYPNTANGTFGNSFQIVFNVSGQVDFAWGNFRNSDSAPCIIGYSEGNLAQDPGLGQASPRAAVPNPAGGLSGFVAAGAFLSGNGDKPPILSSVNRPKHGSTLFLQSSNLDPSIMAVLTFISAGSIPGGLNLANLLGMPGCNAYIVLPAVVDGLDLNLGAPTSTANFGTIPALGPIDVFAQSAGLSIAVPAFNAQNVLVSNAVCLHVDAN